MYETPYKITGPYKQVDFLFLVELTGEKFQIEFFSYNKLTFCSNNISLNVLQQPYISICMQNTYKSFSFLLFSILSGVRQKISFYYEFFVNTLLQLLTFSIVLLFHILPELEVSWCILYIQHVLYCFICVVLTFCIYKCCFDLQQKKAYYFWNRFKKRKF